MDYDTSADAAYNAWMVLKPVGGAAGSAAAGSAAAGEASAADVMSGSTGDAGDAMME